MRRRVRLSVARIALLALYIHIADFHVGIDVLAKVADTSFLLAQVWPAHDDLHISCRVMSCDGQKQETGISPLPVAYSRQRRRVPRLSVRCTCIMSEEQCAQYLG